MSTHVTGVASALTFGLSLFFARIGIAQAKKRGWLDIPSARRRHLRPTPIVGGIGVFAAWAVGTAFYSFTHLPWWFAHLTGVVTLGASLVALSFLGLFDDLKSLGPWTKLAGEFLLAGLVLAFVPELRPIIHQASEYIGVLSWILAAFWIVGVTNGINLIDGLDGLAGGVTASVCFTIAMIAVGVSSGAAAFAAEFVAPLALLLASSVLAFLVFNWNPARIFLGDNGSLPLGFFVAVGSLAMAGHPGFLRGGVSTGLMIAYPILDMSICVWRRLSQRRPVFKADRSHIHFRLQRLGLTARQTAIFILSLGVLFQCAALVTRDMVAERALVLLAAVLFGLFSVVYLIEASERSRVGRLMNRAAKKLTAAAPSQIERRLCPVATIFLGPLLESGLHEERERVHDIMASLKLLLKSALRGADQCLMSRDRISLIFVSRSTSPDSMRSIEAALREQLSLFQKLFGVQYSLSALPIELSARELLLMHAAEAGTEEITGVFPPPGAQDFHLETHREANA